MQRIGLVASRMAQGNVCKYNLFVVVISCLCSFLIFLVSGFSILAALLLISIVSRWFMPVEFAGAWPGVTTVAMIALGVVIGVVNVIAIIKNVKAGKTNI